MKEQKNVESVNVDIFFFLSLPANVQLSAERTHSKWDRTEESISAEIGNEKLRSSLRLCDDDYRMKNQNCKE